MIVTGANLISACTILSGEGATLAETLLGLGTVDSLHWAEAGITLETGVSAWADQSGNGNHILQASTTLQPLTTGDINGKLAVRFDGTDDYLNGAWARAEPFTGLTVCVPSRSAAAAKTVMGAGTGNWMMLDTRASSKLRWYGGVDSIEATSDLDAGQLVTWVANGASSSVDINDGTPATGNGSFPQGGMTLGARGGAFANPGDCDIALVCIYTAITAPNLVLAQAASNAHYTLF